MAIVKCNKGHYYDDSKYNSCPMCDRKRSSNDIDEKTVAYFAPKADDERTISINFKKTNCDPVVGWLVCIDGPEKGRDFRLHSGRNFIGRDLSNDIYLPSDNSISRKNEGYLVYDPKSNSFLIMNGEGASIFLNDKLLSAPHKLENYDVISIGKYKFDFISYCREDKKW